jgi:hypothetical protein
MVVVRVRRLIILVCFLICLFSVCVLVLLSVCVVFVVSARVRRNVAVSDIELGEDAVVAEAAAVVVWLSLGLCLDRCIVDWDRRGGLGIAELPVCMG